jgi:hypothetical protein
MDDSKLPTPHNNLFHYALSHPHAARDLIQTHLPADLVAAMDLDSLKLQKDTFIDEELRECYSDLLYWVQLADHDAKRGQGQVYLLLEHKSQSDPMTCFQLLRYIVRIWEQQLRRGQPLCPVFPLVVYHGQEAWSSPRSLEDLIGGPRNLFQYGVRLAYPVLDLGQIPDESLAGEPFLQSILGLLKYSRRRKKQGTDPVQLDWGMLALFASSTVDAIAESNVVKGFASGCVRPEVALALTTG